MVFASPSGQFFYNMTNRAHLSGPRHLDSFIVTKKSCPLTGTLQKRMPTLTRTATQLNRRAVMLKHQATTRQDNSLVLRKLIILIAKDYLTPESKNIKAIW
jgi:hypothetical protein